MAYRVKELFYSIQGEGLHAGRPAVFCRFSGCNLWSGRNEDRKGSVCSFCDTDILGIDGPGGGVFETSQDLVTGILAHWPAKTDLEAKPFVVLTGGEPLLQVDSELTAALKASGVYVAVETNGTLEASGDFDWISVSPKSPEKTVQKSGNELKLVYPQEQIRPEDVADWGFAHFLLQPMDGRELEKNTQAALEYCLAHPQWRIGLQLHKILQVR
jgi:7-carboxy-7-deazaguanine synthase